MPKGSRGTAKRCKTCAEKGVATNRPAPHPGPRCATCWREETRRRKAAAHAAHVAAAYGLTAEEYKAVWTYQGGVCAGCGRATGATRKLSVDHRHSDGLVRMLLCRVCNNYLGWVRDDPEALRRLAAALVQPPAVVVLGERFVPLDGAPTKRVGSSEPSKRKPARRKKR